MVATSTEQLGEPLIANIIHYSIAQCLLVVEDEPFELWNNIIIVHKSSYL